MRLPISIIIPTLNEEKYLPVLLDSIAMQTTQPTEVLVADALSSDETLKIAKSYGCKIAKGGPLAIGRNNGAKLATQEILLFVDADMVLPFDFLEIAYQEIVRKKLDIAACFGSPLSSSKIDSILFDGAKLYMKLTEKVFAHGGGPCIFIKKSIHSKIGGFDEHMFMNEDHDYVRRASKKGRFSYLSSKLFISVRRLQKEGRLKLLAKYTIAEMHYILIGPMRRPLYRYEFGDYHSHEDS